MRPSLRSILLLPLLVLILLSLALGAAHAQQSGPEPLAPSGLPLQAPIASDMAAYAPLAMPSGYTAFDGAAAFSVADAMGAVYVSAYGKMDGIWATRVFRCAPSCVVVDLGVLPSARGSMMMEPSGLWLTVWDNKQIYRIKVKGAQPWPPVIVVPRLALPLVGQH